MNIKPGTPTTATIPFVDLNAQYRRLKDDIDRRIATVLNHGGFIMGPEVGELEAELARRAGVGQVVSVSSGTDALLIALMADGIGPGDAVFLPAFTFTATAEVVLVAGAVPVFVDVDRNSCNLDPVDLERRIRETRSKANLRPRAIIAVDLYGLPADYDRLGSIARREQMLLIGDAAQSFGAAFNGRPVGVLAPVTATSFFPAKPLGCYGDGGALFTDDRQRADLYRSIRVHGQGTAKYDVARVGMNGRLDTLQAAILMAKLNVFNDELAARGRLASLYDTRLRGAVELAPRMTGSTSAWAQYTVRLPNRDKVASGLKGRGVPTAVYYPRPMHLQPAYQRYGTGPGSLPVSEELCEQVLSLPMHPYLDDATAHRICDALLAEIPRG